MKAAVSKLEADAVGMVGVDAPPVAGQYMKLTTP